MTGVPHMLNSMRPVVSMIRARLVHQVSLQDGDRLSAEYDPMPDEPDRETPPRYRGLVGRQLVLAELCIPEWN
jgi:hypothetical protein